MAVTKLLLEYPKDYSYYYLKRNIPNGFYNDIL